MQIATRAEAVLAAAGVGEKIRAEELGLAEFLGVWEVNQGLKLV